MSESTDAAPAAWLGLTDWVCVITGAGSGIGAVLDRDAESAAGVAAAIERTGGRAIGVQADVARAYTVAAAATRIQTELGPCRVLVNNAAARHREALLEMSMEAWNRVLGVNLTGALVCTQVFAAQMIAAGRGGSIVHVGSILGHHPQIDGGAYSVSKAGLGMLSRMLSLELAQHHIRSNVVSPGFTRTPANEASYQDPDTAAARQRRIPLGRVATAAELAPVIAFLASDRASYVDGQEIVVDGGVSNTLMSVVPRPPS